MRIDTILLLLVVAISLLGCQHVPKPVTRSGGLVIGTGAVRVDVWVSDACPQDGETVTARATVTNGTIEPHVYDSKDQSVLDLIVTTGGTGGVTTRWSDGKALTPDLTHLELQPGQSKTIEMDLRVPDSGALYDATATLYYSNKFNPAGAYVSFAGPHGCSIIDLP
jgi:hypothetical protein